MKTSLDRKDLVFKAPELGCVLSLPGLPGGGSKIYDRSPYGNHGTITGATWKRLPSGLWCPSFDGIDDYIDVGTNSILDFTSGDFTIEVWLYPDAVDAIGGIYDKGTYQQDGILYWMDSSARLELNTSQSGANQKTVSTAIMVAETWQHVAAVRKGTVVKLFRNGSETSYALQGSHSDPASTTDAARIGWGYSNPYAWDGYLALPRIYNRALSALEMQNHFNREKSLFAVW